MNAEEVVKKLENTYHVCAYKKGSHQIKTCPRKKRVIQYIIKHELLNRL